MYCTVALSGAALFRFRSVLHRSLCDVEHKICILWLCDVAAVEGLLYACSFAGRKIFGQGCESHLPHAARDHLGGEGAQADAGHGRKGL